MIWIPNSTEAWEAVQVVSSDANSVMVKRKNSAQEVKVSGNIATFSSVTMQALEENCDNLVDLESYNEGIIIHNIRKRFAVDNIYTLVGNILIALNPYKPLDIYSPAIIDRIYNRVKNNEDLAPHIFTIAATAVNNMKQDRKNQSVLISGESGAGKTEATKKILQFVSAVCAATGSRAGSSIEHQILDSNPLLEAFGNAKTVRNNNSSRFGKYMEVCFDTNFKIKGCRVTAYLLEKSRVVTQGNGERSYHIFYMLLAGANKDWRRDFSLRPAEEFLYLSRTGCLNVDRRDDMKEFTDLLFAMNSLGLDVARQAQIFMALAAVLHLGNLTFQPARDTENGSKVSVAADCKRAASLLGVDGELLERALTFRDSTVNGELLRIPQPPERAMDQRDSLAKWLYGRLFDLLVLAVNGSLGAQRPSAFRLGVLDIFGFEVFTVNSFEQLCINYCNERLQTFFNEVVFEAEMTLYAAEGLPVDDITFADNLGCVRLVDLRGGGIFAYLDEECAVPKGNDEKFVSKLNQLFDESTATRSPFFARNHKSPLLFTVRHFAGDVHYSAAGFLEKNRDALAENLRQLVTQHSSWLGPLFAPLEQAEVSAAAASTAAATGSGKGSSKKESRMTLSAKFKSDLDSLVNALRTTSPHFVRCIKPNAEQAPRTFDGPLALNQLKYSGLFEAIRIRKAGYEVRMPHALFIQRYQYAALTTSSKAKSNKQGSNSSNNLKEKAEVILTALHTLLTSDPRLIEKKRLMAAKSSTSGNAASKGGKAAAPAPTTTAAVRESCVGESRVFLRTNTLKLLFDEARELFKGMAAIPMQRIIRGFISRRRFLRALGKDRALLEEQRKKDNLERILMSSEDDLSREIEKLWKNDRALQTRLATARTQRQREEKERQAKRLYQASQMIQARLRGCLTRRKIRPMLCELWLEQALSSRDEELIRRALDRPRQWNVSSKLINHYRKAAKQLILEVMHESFVDGELRQSCSVRSLPLIKEAISLAEENRMTYLPAYDMTKKTMEQMLRNREVLTILSDELAKCNSVPLLIARTDVIRFLVMEATRRGLGGETTVRDALQRLQAIQRPYEQRQQLRHALEICAPAKLLRLLRARRREVKVFGEAFLQQESTAAENMLNMLRYQQTLLGIEDSKDDTSNSSSKRQMNMHEIYWVMICGRDPVDLPDFETSILTSSNIHDDIGGEDIYLPRFVRDPLHRMKAATSNKERQAALTEFESLVPSVFQRKFYLRLFKWTVAFSTWRTEENPYEHLALDLAVDITISPSRASESPVKTLFPQSPSAGSDNKKSPGNKTLLLGMSSPEQLLQRSNNIGLKVKFSGDNRSPSPSHHQLPPPPRSGGGNSGGSNMPYTQRQSRSEVVAKESIRKGKALHFRHYEKKTDSMINESIASFEKFKQKITHPSTF